MRGLTKRKWRKEGKLVTTSTPGRVYGGMLWNRKPTKPSIDLSGTLNTPIPTQQNISPATPDQAGTPTGTPVGEKTVVAYADMLQNLVSDLVHKQLETLWNSEAFAKMDGDTTHSAPTGDTSSTVEQEQRKQVATFAARAVEDLFGLDTLEGIHLPSRVQRMAAGVVGEQIRAALHRKKVIEGLLAVARGEMARKDAPGTAVEKRNTQRHINTYITEHGHPPANFFDVEPYCPEHITPTVPLSTVDDIYTFWQLPTQPTGTQKPRLVLSLCFPTKDKPAARSDWSWASVDVAISEDIFASYLAGSVLLCLPTLQVCRNKLKANITIDRPTPTQLLNPRTVLSFDWGSKKLLTGALLWETTSGVVKTSGPGHMFVFQANTYIAKDFQRQARAEFLRGKIDQCEAHMTTTTSEAEKVRLGAKIAQYACEARNIDAKRKHANTELARLAARWAVSQALACGAGMVVIENLDSMEPTFGKKLRNRLSQLIRGMLRDALKIACAKAGIEFREVDPAYTSKTCFSCGEKMSFRTAPNGVAGHAWAVCKHCGLSCDRDYNAAVNIGVRELRNPGTGKERTEKGHQSGKYRNDLGSVVVQRIRHGKKIPTKRTSPVHNIHTGARPETSPQKQEQPPVVLADTNPENSPHQGTTAPQDTSELDYSNQRKNKRSNPVCTVPRPGARASEVLVVHRWVRRTSSEADTATPSENSASPSTRTALPPPPAGSEQVSVQVRVLDGMRYAHRHSINATPVRLPHEGFELVDRLGVMSGVYNKP